MRRRRLTFRLDHNKGAAQLAYTPLSLPMHLHLVLPYCVAKLKTVPEVVPAAFDATT